MRLSIVIPVFNERATILDVLARVTSTLLPEGVSREVLVVDDASTDGTRELLEAQPSATFRLMVHPTNRGKSAALRTGIAVAEGDFLIVQDADLEYDPQEYGRLLEPILAGRADVVYGSRFSRKLGWKPGFRSIHAVGNRTLTAISNLLSGLSLTDMETCYKLFRMEAIRGIDLRSERFGFEPEVTIKLARTGQWRIVEVPISYTPRGYSEGKKIGIRDAFHAIWVMVTARFSA